MTTRPQEQMLEQQPEVAAGAEDTMLVCCLDVLRGAAALVARHKVELAGLLAGGGPQTRGVVERLVGDLTEALCGAGGASSGSSSTRQRQEEHQHQQERKDPADEEAMAVEAEEERAGHGGGVEASGVKRAKGQQPRQQPRQQQQQQQQQQQGQQQGAASRLTPWCARAEALGLAEVVEHIMSFAKGRELLGRLSRVCRLWRRVSEGESLCLPVVQQVMPAALLKDEEVGESLHERLGGSARRCLLLHNTWTASGRLMCKEPGLPWNGFKCLVEVFYRDTALFGVQGRGELESDEDCMSLTTGRPSLDVEPFIPGSMGVNSVHDLFAWGRISARFCVMDVATGVTACLFQATLVREDTPELAFGCFPYNTIPVPVTCMTYAGPPLQAQLHFSITPDYDEEEGEEEETIHLQTQRPWTFGEWWTLRLIGQPAIYGERFIRTRLAEEAMAIKQQGR